MRHLELKRIKFIKHHTRIFGDDRFFCISFLNIEESAICCAYFNLGLVLSRHWTNHCLQSKNSSQIQSKKIYTWLLLFFNSEQLIWRKVQRKLSTNNHRHMVCYDTEQILPIELDWTKKWNWFSLVLNA